MYEFLAVLFTPEEFSMSKTIYNGCIRPAYTTNQKKDPFTFTTFTSIYLSIYVSHLGDGRKSSVFSLCNWRRRLEGERWKVSLELHWIRSDCIAQFRRALLRRPQKQYTYIYYPHTLHCIVSHQKQKVIQTPLFFCVVSWLGLVFGLAYNKFSWSLSNPPNRMNKNVLVLVCTMSSLEWRQYIPFRFRFSFFRFRFFNGIFRKIIYHQPSMEKFKRKAGIEVVSGRVEGGGGAGRRTSKKIN